MEISRPAPQRHDNDDSGFSLVETIMALVVLGTILIITITVIGTAFRTLGDARETDVANNVGQARIEAIRSLSFADVGTVAGSPAGTITPSETVELQGISMQVDTTVEWVGSASGLDIVPTGGDGVPGFFNPGIDYKLVTVTVTPESGDNAIVFQTIVSPPNVAATEGAANLIVSIAKDEPSWAPSDASLPRVYLHEPFGSLAGQLNSPQPLFADLSPATVYDIRLGPDPADTSDGTWAMNDPTLSSTVSAAVTSTQVLSIFRPITLEVSATDTAGNLLPGATLVVTDPTTGTDHSFTGLEMVAGQPGSWSIDELGGAPIKHGVYTYVVSAPNHVTSTPVSVQAPQGYPTNVVESTTVTLTPTASTTDIDIEVTDDNGVEIHDAVVTVTPLTSSPYSLSTDDEGEVTLTLDDAETYDIAISSPYGHVTNTAWTGVTTADFPPSGKDSVVLSTPAASALLELDNGPGAASFTGRFQYRRVGSTDTWFEALPNDTGGASVVVTQHTMDGSFSRWEARILCDGDTSGGPTVSQSFNPLVDHSLDVDDSHC